MSAPPARFWLLPLAVAALRTLPALSLAWTEPPRGTELVGVGYLRMDFLAYASFVRQTAADGSFLLADAFTTEPQSPRFVLLFHALVGLAARAAGVDAVTALEASRVPLVFAFFGVLWWFLRPLLPDAKERMAAAVLVAFAGGVECFVRPFPDLLPGSFSGRADWETSQLQGWSLFAGAYNPLWMAALALAMVVLRPLLFEETRSAARLALANAAFAAIFFTHPYTAVGVAAIAATAPAAALLFGERERARRHLAAGLAMAPAALALGAISLWQLADPVYRASSGGVLGPRNLSMLWYPLTLGLLGALAVLGARRWIAAAHPHRAAVLGWLGVVALLHSLPFLNGYKFVFLLPLPLCVLAAPVAREWLAGPRWRALAAGLLLFGGAALQTVEAVREAPKQSAVPIAWMDVARALARRPAGNALVPPELGNVVPAFAPQRVWVGHWFLTPDYLERVKTLAALLNEANAAPRLRNLARAERLRYVAVPAARAPVVADAFAGTIAERASFGELELFVLRPE